MVCYLTGIPLQLFVSLPTCELLNATSEYVDQNRSGCEVSSSTTFRTSLRFSVRYTIFLRSMPRSCVLFRIHNCSVVPRRDLRQKCYPYLSHIAIEERRYEGHCFVKRLFSPMSCVALSLQPCCLIQFSQLLKASVGIPRNFSSASASQRYRTLPLRPIHESLRTLSFIFVSLYW